MFRPGQRVRCIDAKGAGMLLEGAVYTVSHMEMFGGQNWVHLSEVLPASAGWYPNRFREDDQQDFQRFMDRVMKPVKLDQPVAA